MKSFYILSCFIMVAFFAKAQNVQLHYDFGEDRNMPTTTVEMFKRDNYGNSFFFVDFDYGGKRADVNGITRGYWEIARELRFWKAPVAIHLEFDGGLFRNKTISGAINNSYLFGLSYGFNNEDFSRTFSLQLLYKYIEDKNNLAFQITAVWGIHLFNKKLSITGFADFWRQDNIVFDNAGNAVNTNYVFNTEPQVWYNFSSHFSIGGEVETSYNFSGNKGFMANPTVAVKWIF